MINNPINIEFLSDDHFFEFFGITETEFENIMVRERIPPEVKSQKAEVLRWYNGYVYKNIKILNAFSVANFIILKQVKSFWRRSGLATGLWEALHSDSIRNEVFELLDDIPLLIELKELNSEDFCLLDDGRYQVLRFNRFDYLLLSYGEE